MQFVHVTGGQPNAVNAAALFVVCRFFFSKMLSFLPKLLDGDEVIIRTTTVKRKRSKYDDGWMTEDDFTDICDSDEENERMEEDNPSRHSKKKRKKGEVSRIRATTEENDTLQLRRWSTDRMVQWVREVRKDT